MHAEKISISIPLPLSSFIKDYQTSHHFKSRSEVIQEALKVLREKELECAYYEASKEADPDFEITAFDGLEDETW